MPYTFYIVFAFVMFGLGLLFGSWLVRVNNGLVKVIDGYAKSIVHLDSKPLTAETSKYRLELSDMIFRAETSRKAVRRRAAVTYTIVCIALVVGLVLLIVKNSVGA